MNFTLAELANFTGKNGQPAYFAIDGKVYDVSGHADWITGDEIDLAGKDLTNTPFDKSPHKEEVLAKLPVVGRLLY